MASSRLVLSGCYFLMLLLSPDLASSSTLSPYYYDNVCPKALATIKKVVKAAINKEQRMGASLLRLHFHDCFVQGCDGSILLDATSTMDSEKDAVPNANSIRGFEVVDQIKTQVDKICGRPVVSCADILAIAARDSVVALGGPSWTVQLGRRDSTTASKDLANTNLPSPFMDLQALTNNFMNQGLDTTDLVALSGGHTIGFARCVTFRNRTYNDANIDVNFANKLKSSCPVKGGDANLAVLDPTPAQFDSKYFNSLVDKKGLLESDQALFNGGSTDSLVKKYGSNYGTFSKDFARSMVKMGNINLLTGARSQVRANCRKVNR